MPSEKLGSSPHFEYEAICRLIPEKSRVLDLGCGEGDLLKRLQERSQAQCMGVEVAEEKVYLCIEKGLVVHHGDIDEGLADFPDRSFDYVILSETLQEIYRPSLVIQEMLRVGRCGIVTFPNFAYWKSRWQLFFTGRTPVTETLPYRWYETPNVQFLSILDFEDFCKVKNYTIEQRVYFNEGREVKYFPNLLAESALFVIS